MGSTVVASSQNLEQSMSAEATQSVYMQDKAILTRQISANGYLGDSFEQLQDVLGELRLFKKVVSRALREYYRDFERSGNIADAYMKFEGTLRDLNLPNYHHEVVKLGFSIALDLGSEVMNHAFPRLLKQCSAQNLLEDSDVQHGLAIVLGRLDDLALDVPNVRTSAVELFCFCVSEELLSAELVKREEQLEYGGSTGEDVLRSVLHRTPEYSRKIWGGGGDARALTCEIDRAVEEYFDSYDMEEVARIFGELHLSKEDEVLFIERLVLFSIEHDAKGRTIQLGLNLLHYLKDIFWGEAEIEAAFSEIRSKAIELVLDVPKISQWLDALVQQALAQGLIEESTFLRDAQSRYV
jgi:hypothetical protein